MTATTYNTANLPAWLCADQDEAARVWYPIHAQLSIRGWIDPAHRSGELALHGEIDAYGAGALALALADVIAVGLTSLHVDLSAVTFIDGAGARTLAVAAHHLETRGGRLRARHPAASVERLLEMTGLGRLLVPS